MELEKLKQILEAALMVAAAPVSFDRLVHMFSEDGDAAPSRDHLRNALEELENDYHNCGIELVKVGSGYRFQARAEVAGWINRLWDEKHPRYSRALLETLAIIAYRQPITRGEIESIRGVAVSTNIIRTLLEREWARVVGHRDVPGKPAVYATTKQFLDYFNLASLADLPSLAELKDVDDINADLFAEADNATFAPPEVVSEADDAQAESPVEMAQGTDALVNVDESDVESAAETATEADEAGIEPAVETAAEADEAGIEPVVETAAEADAAGIEPAVETATEADEADIEVETNSSVVETSTEGDSDAEPEAGRAQVAAARNG